MTLSEAFNIIVTANKEESRHAARRVRKLVYSDSDEEKYKTIVSIIETAPQTYTSITEEFRQENFVMAISVMYFLREDGQPPDRFFPWLLELIQHKNGYIRYAAVRMLESELGPLTVYIRHPDFTIKDNHVTPLQANTILYYLYVALHNLSNQFWQPEFKKKKYKYISDLPSGPYKSIEMVLSTIEEYCGKEYLEKLHDPLHFLRPRI